MDYDKTVRSNMTPNGWTGMQWVLFVSAVPSHGMESRFKADGGRIGVGVQALQSTERLNRVARFGEILL